MYKLLLYFFAFNFATTVIYNIKYVIDLKKRKAHLNIETVDFTDIILIMNTLFNSPVYSRNGNNLQ